ncbi:MAG: DivIVA domain-containing protein [Caldicoprobacterales bacterium]|nr:DivIVA domain-containing protein [Clostridiales bacterium]
MALTPMDIHNKEFTRSFRGYDEDEVDQFLDEIVEEFERLYKENIDLKDRLSMVVDQINNYKTMENTLKETLVTAQKTADELTESAQKKSELIIKEAEGKAREIIDNAHTKVLEIKKEFDEYRKQMQVFRSRFKNLLETQLEILQQEIPTYEDIDNESLPKG